MDFNQALDLTIKKYGIEAKALARRAGLHPQTISDFRRGHKDMTTKNLKKILNGMREEEKKHFYKLIGVPSGDIRSQLDQMSAEELSQLIVEIADLIPKIAQGQRELQEV
jgi:predicted transcriptional regulator